jgi:hypothetical protein
MFLSIYGVLSIHSNGITTAVSKSALVWAYGDNIHHLESLSLMDPCSALVEEIDERAIEKTQY